MNNTIKGMIIFATTVERGSMAAAAQDLNISSSAISQQISKLEQDMQINLLHRSTRNLTLTEAGRIFYESCIKIIAMAEHTQQLLNELRETPLGELRIATPVGFAGSGLLSEPLKNLIHNHSQLKINLMIQDGTIDIISERVDLALCIGPLPDSNLVARHLVDWDLILCASPAYLKHAGIASAGDITEPEQLKSLDWLSHTYSQQGELIFTGSNGKKLPVNFLSKMKVNNMQALIQFTQDGLGFAALPEPEIRQALKQGSLIRLVPDWSLPKFSVYAVTPTRDAQPAKVRTAIDILNHYLRNLPPLL
ncbi:LysR family transcriptional regulator [Chromatiaceae bacterium AAb-1]|nr:LysR family transcriptional regulator [Chromatiaceae bacterium AAb-1]